MYDSGCGASVSFRGEFFIQTYRPDNSLKWEVLEKNMVVNVGVQKLLDILLMGSAAIATWYVGLAASSMTVASADTMASHGGWTESTVYATAARGVFVGVRTALAVTNSASTISYSISTAGTIGGAFLASDATKGGSLGTLLCAVVFTAGDKAVTDGDTLTVTYSFSAADS